MTTNQIEYLKYREAVRTNKANEDIKRKFNQGTLFLGNRTADISQQDANTRQRLAQLEAEKVEIQRGNLDVASKNAETNRINAQINRLGQETARARQIEDKRHNLTNEYYQGVEARQNTRSRDQNDRSLNIAEYNAITGRQNVGLGYANVGLGYSNLGLGYANLGESRRHNLVIESETPSRILSHQAGSIGAVTPLIKTAIGLLGKKGTLGAAALGGTIYLGNKLVNRRKNDMIDSYNNGDYTERMNNHEA